VIILLVYPVFSSIYFSFTNKNLIKVNYKFIGLDNFKSILNNVEFYRALFTSTKWTICSILCQLLVGFTAALALDRIPKYKGIYRTLLIIPWAFPTIIIALSWKWILNGIYGFVPNFLVKAGFTDNLVQFFSNPDIVFWTVLFVNVWFGAPLFMVNVLSALQTIPRDHYEAIRIDGANQFQSFWYITLRHVRVVIGLLLVLRTIWVFNNFELIFLLTGGGPSDLTTTIPIFAYRTGWGLKQLGVASAITVLLLILLFCVCFVYFALLNKWEREDEMQ
jgi:multiple sugar transport system permease protein